MLSSGMGHRGIETPNLREFKTHTGGHDSAGLGPGTQLTGLVGEPDRRGGNRRAAGICIARVHNDFAITAGKGDAHETGAAEGDTEAALAVKKQTSVRQRLPSQMEEQAVQGGSGEIEGPTQAAIAAYSA